MSGDVNTPPPPAPTLSPAAPTPAPTRNGPRHVVSRGISEEWLEQDLRRFNRQKAYFANYAHYGPIRRNMMLVASATPFEVGIYVVLVLNCFFLGVQNIKSLQSIQTASVTLDAVFTSCYVAEMIFKLIALGPRMYLSRYWNWIDGSLAIASATGLIVYYSVPSATSTLPTILRVFQLIRPLRMLTALSALRVLLRALGASVRRLGNVAVLTGAFMTLMALIALAFFRFCFENECQTVQFSGIDTISNGSVVFEGLQLYQDDLAPVCVASGNIPQPFWFQRNNSGPNYNPSDVEFIASTLANATTTVLPVAALNDNYNGLVCPFGAYCVPGVGPDNGYSSFNSIFSSTILLYTILSLEGWSSIMFNVVDALGAWVSLYFIANVVVGTIFVLNLVLATVSDAFGRSIKYQMRFTRSSTEYKSAIGNPNGTWSGMIIPAGLSMMTLPTTTMTDVLHKISEGVRLYALHNRAYQFLRPLAALVSVIILATTSNGMNDDHRDFIETATKVFTILFSIENGVEIIGMRGSFFLDPIRVFDLLVTIGAIVELSLNIAPTAASLRLFRLIEVLMRFPALRKQIRVLKYVIGDLMPLLLFMLVLLFLASLVGTQLFAGLYCGLDTTSPNRVDTSLCDNVPRLNFDNIGYSAVSVFVIFCGDGWRSMMVQGMQTRGDYSALYFCLCYLIGGYLMLNLFVAVMITSADMLEDEPEQTLLVRSEHVSFLDPVSVASGVFGGGASSRRSSLRGVGTTIDGAAEGDEEMATANNDDGDLVREASMEVFANNDSLARTSRQTSAEFEQENINSSFILGSGAKAQRAARAAALLSRASSARSVTSTRDVPPLPLSPKKQSSLKQSSQVHPSSKPSDVASENRHFPLMVSSFALGEGMEDLLGTPSSVEPLPRGRTRSVRFEDEKLDRLLGDSPKATPPPALLPRPSKDNDDSDDDDPLKLSMGLLKLMDSLQSSSKFEADGSPTSMSESTAQRVLDDEVEYDVINRHTDVNDLETLRKEYRDVYNKEVADLPWLRRTAGSIVKSRRFDIVYTVVVFYSMVTVALGHMTDYPDSTMSQFKEWSDLVVALLFLSEALLKILHYGVFHKKKSLLKGYFNYRWNIFDFSVMVLSLVVACVVFTQNRTFRQVANWMRLARLLRPFSLIGRHEGLKVVARSTLASVPSIRNVGLLTILVWVSFSAFGTRLFAGRFSACTDVDWGDMTYGALGTVTDEATCLAKNFTWQPADRNFDTFGSSLLTLFQVATVDNWSDIMFMGADSSGEMGQAPKPRSRVYMIPFFVVYILLTNFFLIQFFIASMCDVYFTVKAQMEDDLRSRLLQSHEVFLDPDQKAYLGMYRRALFFVKPPLHVSIEEGSIRSYLRRIVRHKTFEPIQTIIVIVHIVLESLVFADNPPLSANTLLVIDWVFTGYFCLSAGCTWFVYGTRNFLDSSRGRGSIMNNILTMAGLILEATNANEGAASLLRQMRVFRLYRIFYVTQTIQVLVDTLLYSLPSFANVFFLLFLVFYVYAAVGMQLFGRVQFTYDRVGVGQYANFDRFDKALIALLRVATFDDWTELMYSCTVQTPVCSDQLGDCAPYPLVAYIYFLSFAVVGQWIGINFFAAEIIDAFTHAEMEERYAIQEHDVARFQRLWKEIAGSGEGHMSIGQLSVFLMRLGLPLGPVFGDAPATPEDSTSGPLSAIQNLAASFSKPQSPTASTSSGTDRATASLKHNFKFSEVLKFMASLEIPLVNNSVLQGSTFDALMRHFYATPLPPKYEKILGRVLNSRFQTRQFIRKAAESQTRQSDVDALHAALDFSSSVANRGSSGTYSPTRSSGGQSFWDLYHSEQQRSARVPGQLMYSSGGETLRMAVAATILQSRWRGARIRELVRMSKQQSPSNAFGDTSGAKSFAKKQPRRMYKATSASNYDSSEVPLLREDPSEFHASLEHSGRRMRRSSVAAYNKPQKFVSIVERLKAKHSELI